MSFHMVPCPELYLRHKKTKPKLFVQYCESFTKKNDPGRKAVGIRTINEQVYIMTMPDYDSVKAIVKGKGKTKTVTHVPMYKGPIERFLTKEDFDYLQQNGRDRYGNKIKG